MWIKETSYLWNNRIRKDKAGKTIFCLLMTPCLSTRTSVPATLMVTSTESPSAFLGSGEMQLSHPTKGRTQGRATHPNSYRQPVTHLGIVPCSVPYPLNSSPEEWAPETKGRKQICFPVQADWIERDLTLSYKPSDFSHVTQIFNFHLFWSINSV